MGHDRMVKAWISSIKLIRMVKDRMVKARTSKIKLIRIG